MTGPPPPRPSSLSPGAEAAPLSGPRALPEQEAALEPPARGRGARAGRALQLLFPFLRWFERYGAAHARADLQAGLTVALVLIPQSMAYARLAGLPAYYGLYSAFLPPVVAALFGSSQQLSTGPVAVVSLLTAASLEPLATAGGPHYIAYAVLLSLLVGLFQLCLGVFRLGVVVNFLSHPVVNGFTNAGALIIASSRSASAALRSPTAWRTAGDSICPSGAVRSCSKPTAQDKRVVTATATSTSGIRRLIRRSPIISAKASAAIPTVGQCGWRAAAATTRATVW